MLSASLKKTFTSFFYRANLQTVAGTYIFMHERAHACTFMCDYVYVEQGMSVCV